MKNYLLFFITFNYYLCNKKLNINNSSYIIINNKTFTDNSLKNSALKKKNAILGIIQRYSLYQIFPFFKSLLSINCKNCDIIMFVRNISKDVIKYLQNIGVFVFEIPDKFKNISVINLRWKLYIDFLKENKKKYKLVLHSDIRDTIFQKDIFRYYEDHKPFLGIAIEDGFLNKGLNKKWLVEYVGFDKYKIIQNKRIICVGTIWGTSDIFLNFSIYFWERLQANPNSIEQGIANYMIYYEKLFGKYILKSDNYGPVMTLSLAKSEKIFFDNQNNILNYKGEKAAVIHQYDRKPFIVKKVINKYCPELKIFMKEIDNIKLYHEKMQFIQNLKMKKKYTNIFYFFLFLILFILIIFYKYKN